MEDFLLFNKMDVYDKEYNNMLGMAIIDGNINRAFRIIQKCDRQTINHKNIYGETPLHISYELRMWDVCNMLLEYGAEPIRNNEGKLPGTLISPIMRFSPTVFRNDTCPITLECPMPNPIQFHPCKHIFSGEAISKALETSSLCPTCRCIVDNIEILTIENCNKKVTYI